MVLIGCVLLFGAGAIWAAIPIGTNFFVVGNVHDLFEIIAAAATTIAVCFAAAGLNAWKSQISATADHELARRVAVALSRYKDSTLDMWNYAEFSLSQFQQVTRTSNSALDESFNTLIKSRLDASLLVRAEVKSLAVECRAVWGKEFEKLFQGVFIFERRVSSCVNMYLTWSAPDPMGKAMASHSLNKYGIESDALELVSVELASSYVESLVDDLDTRLAEKLLR